MKEQKKISEFDGYQKKITDFGLYENDINTCKQFEIALENKNKAIIYFW